MRNLFQTPFAAVFTNEVLLNIKRVAPYVLMAFFASNALLWWGWGPAVGRGWATNAEFYIQRNMGAFSFILGLPIFTAVIMGDAVIRDFRLGLDPLIFSKPLGRGSYLLGKFLGNFFVLVCCQSAFAVTLFLLQWIPFSGMVVLPLRSVPYFKHFFFIVVISHLVLAAIYFAAGTLTRKPKVVYGLAACFYPAYVAYQLLLLKNLPGIVGVITDPLGWSAQFGLGPGIWQMSSAFLNQHVVAYGPAAYVNRGSMIIVATICLIIVYLRFRIDPMETRAEAHFSRLRLAEVPDRIAYSSPSSVLFDLPIAASLARDQIRLPKVTQKTGATLFKIIGAMGVEFRLLRAERSLLFFLPVVTFFSFFSVPFSRIASEVSYSVIAATNTANSLLLCFACMIVFYLGEIMHRDREVKIEPVVWSTPAPNSVLLLSKCLAVTLLALSLAMMGCITAVCAQLLRGYTPIDFSAYFFINGLVVVPSIIFMTALVVALNVLLRNKYLAYVVAVGTGAGLFYLYSIGYTHWLYNPLLYKLWKYADLTSPTILAQRLYCLALAAACLVLAHVFFERKS